MSTPLLFLIVAVTVLIAAIVVVVYVAYDHVMRLSFQHSGQGATQPSDLDIWYERATTVGTVVAGGIGLMTVGVTILLIYITWNISKQGQKTTEELNRQSAEIATKIGQAERLSDFSNRFQRLVEMRNEATHQEDPRMYYELFWLLQYDQYQAWHQKLVPNETFKYWLTTRFSAWEDNPEVGPVFSLGTVTVNMEPRGDHGPMIIKYRDGYNKIVGTWKDMKFKAFFDVLHEMGVDAAIASEPQSSRGFGPI